MQRPDLVVVHGSGVTAFDYRRLAAALSEHFTVHVYDRRGRTGAAPQGDGYTVQDDVDDLMGVLRDTGANRVLAHSYGGFVALRTALDAPPLRIALYDATISVDGLFPTAFLDDCERAVQEGNTALALAELSRGLRAAGPLSGLPLWAQAAAFRPFLRTRLGHRMGGLLPSSIREARQVQAHDGPADRYAMVTAELLLLTGTASPPYYTRINATLAQAVPHACTATVSHAGHDGPNRAPRRLTDQITPFLLTA
jgi:pimeloyl-ACP methyl ester carboxylesterase